MESLLGGLEDVDWILRPDAVDTDYQSRHSRKELALRHLREMTGQNFGYDVRKWREWLEAKGMVPRQNVPAEMLDHLDKGTPPGYLGAENARAWALRRLQNYTGQEFGDDPAKWRAWLQATSHLLDFDFASRDRTR